MESSVTRIEKTKKRTKAPKSIRFSRKDKKAAKRFRNSRKNRS